MPAAKPIVPNSRNLVQEANIACIEADDAKAGAARAMLAALVQHRAASHVENYFGLPDPGAAQAADMADALRMRDAAIAAARAAGITTES